MPQGHIVSCNLYFGLNYSVCHLNESLTSGSQSLPTVTNGNRVMRQILVLTTTKDAVPAWPGEDIAGLAYLDHLQPDGCKRIARSPAESARQSALPGCLSSLLLTVITLWDFAFESVLTSLSFLPMCTFERTYILHIK